MSSKETILRAIRGHLPRATDLPNLAQTWITYADREQQFSSVLEFVGGRAVFVQGTDELNQKLAEMPTYNSAKVIVSQVPGVGKANFNLDAVDDPHKVEPVDFTILPGQFAVAENGAVWVTNVGIKHRVAYFITQHLALVLPAREIVDNMHQAYERLSFENAGYGLFMSGPSKTADIEQSLVIGAHGPRSLTVFFIRDSG